MRRLLSLAIVLLAVGETLMLHWLSLALRGSGLGWEGAALAGLAVAGFNFAVFPLARRNLRSPGFTRMASRGWILASVAALWTGVLLASVFIVLGIGTWILRPEHPEALVVAAQVWIGGAAIALGFGSVAWGASVGNLRVKVDQVALPTPHLSRPHRELRIAHVTDLHIGPLLPAVKLRAFVDRINRLEPDLIVLTGDIFDFDPSYVDPGCRELAALRSRHGVYAVLGNHDVYTGVDTIVEGIDTLTRIRLLRDEWVQVDVGGSHLVIAGIEDPGTRWTERESESPALERLAAEIPKGLPSLLLAHRPSYFDHAARLGFPVVLSGHTHGGQVAPPILQQINPSRIISHRTRGHFRHREPTLYVNRGLGMAGLPLRINCPREIALIRLMDPPRSSS